MDLSAELVDRLKRCTNLPTLPKAAMRIIEVAQQPEIDMGMVAEAVSADPAIAAKVMRIANSALYARRRESTNLRQALITLGLNATLTLALSFTLVTKLREDPIKGFDFNQFWKRSIMAGSWARLLAAQTELVGGEEVFLVALLQDIGMLAIDRAAPAVYGDIAPFSLTHEALASHEQAALGVTHADVGAWLMRHWQMPDMLALAIEYSHDHAAPQVPQANRAMVRVAAMSGLLADSCIGADADEIARACQRAADCLDIPRERLGKLYTDMVAEIPEIERMFEIDLMAADELDILMETAREALLIRNLSVFSQAAELVQRAESLQSENQQLRQASRIDKLTGAYNRRHFEDALNDEFDFAVRHKSSLSMIFVDIDLFKQANDTFGHVVGDRVLREVAQLLRSIVRSSDVVARFGGDEFVIILPGLDRERTAAVAARIVEGARELAVATESGERVPVTLSLGTATNGNNDEFNTAAGMIRAADSALYISKRNGRNRHTAFERGQAA